MGFALSDMLLTSAAFKNGAPIPVKHTGEGEDVSPAMFWRNAPEGTKSFALFCHDPDAPLVSQRGSYGFVHWVLYNMPPTTKGLDEGVKEFASGKNNFGNSGYNGPMPPDRHGTHHYFFWIMALDLEPSLPDGLDLPELLEKVEPHILGMNRLVGTYQRA
ncbi:MAG: YbhB/YbcL family Raf kinase inhibitor-like protein [Pseudohongiellaceae bacterium]